MEKNYCNKCKRLDADLSILVNFRIDIFQYKNLRKSILPENEKNVEKAEKLYALVRSPFSLCDECFIEFMDHKKPKPEDTSLLK